MADESDKPAGMKQLIDEIMARKGYRNLHVMGKDTRSVSWQTLYAWRAGTRKPEDLDALRAFAAEHGVSEARAFLAAGYADPSQQTTAGAQLVEAAELFDGVPAGERAATLRALHLYRDLTSAEQEIVSRLMRDLAATRRDSTPEKGRKSNAC
jgi:hypothetical protein